MHTYMRWNKANTKGNKKIKQARGEKAEKGTSQRDIEGDAITANNKNNVSTIIKNVSTTNSADNPNIFLKSCLTFDPPNKSERLQKERLLLLVDFF